MSAFVEWAGRDAVKLMYTPDVCLAVNGEGRRGYLIDEVYWISIWIGVGGDEFMRCLRELAGAETGSIAVAEPSEDPNPELLLGMALKHGAPLGSRHPHHGR